MAKKPSTLHPLQDTPQPGPDDIFLSPDHLPYPLSNLHPGPLRMTNLTVNDVIFPLLRQMHAVSDVLHVASAHQVVPEETVATIGGWLASMDQRAHLNRKVRFGEGGTIAPRP